MKFLALIYTQEGAWDDASERERTAMYARYTAVSDAARAKGQLVDANELAPTSTATTVRVRDGETLVTDGPFVETKEALGGYYLFECDTIEEAIELAAQIPAAEHGAVEVRPGYVDETMAEETESQEVTA